MTFFKNVRVLGLAAALCFLFSPLVPAQAAKVDQTALKEVVQAQKNTNQEKYIQYQIHSNIFSPRGMGTMTLNGRMVQQQEQADKKAAEPQYILEGKGTAEVVPLAGVGSKKIPFSFYASKDDKQVTQYFNSGKGWTKTVQVLDQKTLQKAKKQEEMLPDFEKMVRSVQVLQDSEMEQLIKITLDNERLFGDNSDSLWAKTLKKQHEQMRKALASMKDFSYNVSIDKEKTRYNRISFNFTPLVHSLGQSVLETVSKEKNLDDRKKEMIQSLIDSSTSSLDIQLFYDQGKEVVIPDEVKNAPLAIEKLEQEAQQETKTEKSA